MRTAFYEAVTEEELRDIVQALVAKAKAGDLAAARLLLTYAIGSPSVKVKNAVIVQGEPAPLPTRPAAALPGSAEKESVFSMRARNGQPLFDPRDAKRSAD